MFGFTCFVVPHSERMVFAASYQILLIPREIDTSNAHAMSTKQVNLLCEEVTNLALSHILISCSVKEDAVIEWNRPNTVNDIIRHFWLFMFNALHWFSLILHKLLILFFSFSDGWHCVVIELSLFFAWLLNVNDSYLSLNRRDKDLITVRHEVNSHEYF